MTYTYCIDTYTYCSLPWRDLRIEEANILAHHATTKKKPIPWTFFFLKINMKLFFQITYRSQLRFPNYFLGYTDRLLKITTTKKCRPFACCIDLKQYDVNLIILVIGCPHFSVKYGNNATVLFLMASLIDCIIL